MPLNGGGVLQPQTILGPDDENRVIGYDFVEIDKTSIGLGNVDNTSDANKPVSTATAARWRASGPSCPPRPAPLAATSCPCPSS